MVSGALSFSIVPLCFLTYQQPYVTLSREGGSAEETLLLDYVSAPSFNDETHRSDGACRSLLGERSSLHARRNPVSNSLSITANCNLF
jgi:hypothetical protein